jgi:hypothetical protein
MTQPPSSSDSSSDRVHRLGVTVLLPALSFLGAALYRGMDLSSGRVYAEIVVFALLRTALDLWFFDHAAEAHARVHGPLASNTCRGVFNVSLVLAIVTLSEALIGKS